MKVTVRKGNALDINFIFSTWLKGQYWGDDHYNFMEQDEYFKEYAKNIERLLSKTGTCIDIAALDGDPSDIRGYVVYNDQVIYWAHVKKEYRKQGILNLLLANMDFESCLSLTKMGSRVMKKKQLRFNPLKEE